MGDLFIEALEAKYDAEIKSAKAVIEVYLQKPVGIGEHPQFLDEIDKQVEKITNAEEKLETLKKHYPNEDDIPFLQEEIKMDKEAKPKQYLVDAKQLQDIMKYLMTRPYGEVYGVMNLISTLKPFNPDGEKNVGKK